ncbi:MAG TPA: hypothetical protein VK504_25315, partial [Vicinamibacterales bacterium]|nr:hypothetical protein [Vicinamibacterales bacterium]
MQFVALGNNCGDWTHYGTCPVNRQPVLVRVVLENSATQSPIAALVTAAADAVYLRISEDVRTGGPVCREVLNRGVLCRMIVTLSLIGGAAGGLLIRYGKRAARAAR